MGEPRKVAILGGGMAGLTAAWELTQPSLAGQFEVTVYQLGWRLGGKGASGRNLEHANRIEEHGLHLWMGCYENAFRVMRDCYAELGRPHGAPLATWEEAFVPRNFTVLQDHYRGTWTPWPQRFPVLDTRPGESERVESPLDLAAAMVRWLVSAVTSQEGLGRFAPPVEALAQGARRPPWLTPLLAGAATWRLVPLLRSGPAGLLLGRIASLGELLRGGRRAEPTVHRALALALRTFRRVAWEVVRGELANPEIRRLYITLDFIATNLVGILAEGLLIPPEGCVADITHQDWLRNLEKIDHLDYRDWLRRHGAREITATSCIVRGLGDAVFNSNHQGSAASALNGLVRLNLTYRGSLFYEMTAGMGEVVFSPLYLALRRRGVRFEFFHRVDALRLSADGAEVVAVDLTRQAKPKGGAYEPLIDVPAPGGALRCWPVHPLWDQLEDGDALREARVDLESPAPVPGEEKVRLEGFDAVVLGISLAGLPAITEELARRSLPWVNMLRGIATTRTQALQLWFTEDTEALGWKLGPPVVTSYAEPLDTWADMTHLLAHEDWGGAAKSLAYFCGSLDDEGTDDAQAARAARTARDWLEEHLGHLLPGMLRAGPHRAIDWDKLVDLGGRTGSGRLKSQYVRANVHPSERYVLSVPGSGRHRLRADGSGFARLYLAGDWVKTGMNVGCIEAAVMAGRQAARAISGVPLNIVGDV